MVQSCAGAVLVCMGRGEQDNWDAAESRRQVVISLNKTQRGTQRSLKQEMYDDGGGIQVVPETGEAF